MKPETCDLYRHYDKEWNLLYVGISLNAIKRLIDHRSQSKEWFDDIAFTQRKTYPSRAEAEKAEAIAIRNENPRHNIDRPLGTASQELHNPTKDLVQSLKDQIDFVRDRRHWEEMSVRMENLEESHREEIDLNNRLREMLLKLRHEFESEKLHHNVPTSYERILADHLGLEWDESNSFRKKKLPKGGKKALEKQAQ